MSTGIKNGKHHTNNICIRKFISLISLLLLISVPLTATRTNKNWVIVIDPGHGGKDPGALGAHTHESDLALAIALKTGEYIEKNIKNATIIYTRKTDSFVELRDRATLANKNKADLFISIHVNSAKSNGVMGTETFTMGPAKNQQNLEVAMKENEVIFLEDDYSTKYEGFDPKSDVSYIMFTVSQNIFREQSVDLASKIQTQFRENFDRHDRDVKQAGFWVLFATSMPSVLVETGFITSPEEEKFLNSKPGQDKIAFSIFRACNAYIDEIDSKSSTFPLKKNTDTVSNIVISNKQTSSSGDIVFMVQIATSTVKIDTKPDNFKGLKNVVELSTEDRLKYATGSFSNYLSAVSYRKEIESVFPDAFVIAVQDNKILPLQQALDQKK